MINRDNWKLIREYLKYSRRVLQHDDKTIHKRRGQYRHLLEWADATPLEKARAIDPTFPVYLHTARNDDKAGSLAPATVAATCGAVRLFFQWLRREHPGKYKGITESWINTLRPGRSRGMQTVVKSHEFYTLEDLFKIAAWVPETLTQERDRASMCMLFLSAMRAGAFVSMPIECVDLDNMRVHQLPARGVMTKNHKAAITALLPIPELLAIVRAWDTRVREELPASANWYAVLKSTQEEFAGGHSTSDGRRIILSRGIQRICGLAGVRYLSPHKLRHGHVVYALKRVSDMAGLKAVSQNLMHSNISITDGIYGGFSDDDVHKLISSIAPGGVDLPAGQADTLDKLAVLLRAIEKNPGILERMESG